MTWDNDTILAHNELASRVLVVAVARLDAPNAWTAYCDAVPGVDHGIEMHNVKRHGDKLSERMARAIFPHIPADFPYIR